MFQKKKNETEKKKNQGKPTTELIFGVYSANRNKSIVISLGKNRECTNRVSNWKVSVTFAVWLVFLIFSKSILVC